ncbi:MAG: helix-hairpin-helix domain-containing protein, partial [Planctomycetota bacterium]
MSVQTLFDGKGRRIETGIRIGAGGEGAVFEVLDCEQLVAKVYHHPAPPEREAKLRRMVALGAPELASFAAWPTATLHEKPGGPVAGLLLPRVERAAPIHELYSPASRRLKFPDADWIFLVRVARNCAAAFATLHERGIVVGDVNQGNLFVTSEAIVRLIDCDSFQVTDGEVIYPCEVGVPHFTPAELHGQTFRSVRRTDNHDCFGLAVILFHLLFMGRHPFAGRCRRTEEMPIERAIREHRFAFSLSVETDMAPPPFSLSLKHLPPPVAEAFERSFGKNGSSGRLPARRWAELLTRFELELVACARDPGHKHWSKLEGCPWCQIMDDGGPNFFETVTVGRTERLLDWKQIWKQVKAVPAPSGKRRGLAQPDLPVAPSPVPRPSAERIFFSRITAAVAITAAVFSAVCLLMPMAMVITVPIAVGFGSWWTGLQLLSERVKERWKRKATLRAREAELENANKEWAKDSAAAQARFHGCLQEISHSIQEYRLFDQRMKAEIEQLGLHREEMQKKAWLQQHLISSLRRSSSGLTDNQIGQLESYGVETANEVTFETLLKIPGIDDATALRLCAWRDALESQFQFDPNQAVAPSELRAVRLKMQRAQLQLEQKLMRGPSELWEISRAERQRLAKGEHALDSRTMEVAKARADLKLCRMQTRGLWWQVG